ncbi:hypothetical protein P3T76_009483 [Phytophthora citrophthora]|uniref:Retrovirus-related Pol polyprotein from transposon TNT 1-94-like beta-barrel domain-containing protein n=1 Tax=Phytophthora citrophthora TaxID=4793 RepID=A0AAD9LIR5_9STRA|nr:hypothetical protein P3T76_009483 [Phytophthora citrophthora]
MKRNQTPDFTLTVSEKANEYDDTWILDSGSSRHLVNNESWSKDPVHCSDHSRQPNRDPLSITKKGSVTLRVVAAGVERTVQLTEVYYSENVAQFNLLRTT